MGSRGKVGVPRTMFYFDRFPFWHAYFRELGYEVVTSPRTDGKIANTGDEPSVVVNKVTEGKGNYGFNAQTGDYGDLVQMGVVDPTKVARFALQNASSIASLLLTTEAMVAELPKDEKPMGGGGMGGMGGMGDMDM